MTTLLITYCRDGREEIIEFDGTREEWIAKAFGEGGLNPVYASVVEMTPAVVVDPVADAPKPKAKKKAADE